MNVNYGVGLSDLVWVQIETDKNEGTSRGQDFVIRNWFCKVVVSSWNSGTHISKVNMMTTGHKL